MPIGIYCLFWKASCWRFPLLQVPFVLTRHQCLFFGPSSFQGDLYGVDLFVLLMKGFSEIWITYFCLFNETLLRSLTKFEFHICMPWLALNLATFASTCCPLFALGIKMIRFFQRTLDCKGILKLASYFWRSKARLQKSVLKQTAYLWEYFNWLVYLEINTVSRQGQIWDVSKFIHMKIWCNIYVSRNSRTCMTHSENSSYPFDL